MKIKALAFAAGLLAMGLCVVSCSNSGTEENKRTAKGKYVKITAEQAKAVMEENKEAIIVDVRTREEYEDVHIPDAVLIPNETIEDEKPTMLPNLDDVILVYCRSGRRSKQAAEKLVSIGYTDVRDFGGINEWPYETVAGKGEKNA
ncbi:MAG: rhodanese-like domain-containing protein [Oscillospiraceae bacterium]